MDNISIDGISFERFQELRSEYSDLIPEDLASLDTQRLQTIPESVRLRQRDGKAFLTKEDLVILVNWKLSHGKFRPSLKGLVQQNSDPDVQQVTGAGFAAPQLKDSMNILTKLRGVGPATASLLLSTWNSHEIPFFSDELFRWCFWANEPGSRWDRKIKYTLKEYEELVTKTKEFRTRMKEDYDQDVAAIDVEMVSYVLGKHNMVITTTEELETQESVQPAQQDKKRKLASPASNVHVAKAKHRKIDNEESETALKDVQSTSRYPRRLPKSKD